MDVRMQYLDILSQQTHKHLQSSCPSARRASPDPLLPLWDVRRENSLQPSSLSFKTQPQHTWWSIKALLHYSSYREKQDRKLNATNWEQCPRFSWILWRELTQLPPTQTCRSNQAQRSQLKEHYQPLSSIKRLALTKGIKRRSCSTAEFLRNGNSNTGKYQSNFPYQLKQNWVFTNKAASSFIPSYTHYN